MGDDWFESVFNTNHTHTHTHPPIAVNEILVHMDTHLPYRWIYSSAVARISRLFIGFIFTNNLHLFTPHCLMCVFSC